MLEEQRPEYGWENPKKSGPPQRGAKGEKKRRKAKEEGPTVQNEGREDGPIISIEKNANWKRTKTR